MKEYNGGTMAENSITPEEVLLKGQILDSLKQLAVLVGNISERDFSREIKVADPEVGKLSTLMEKMRTNLAEMIGEITINANNLSNSASTMTELSSNMMGMAKRMNEKAAQVATDTNGVNESMYTVSAAAEELSVNMKTVSSRASESSLNINNVSAAVEEMTATISEIAKNSEMGKQIVINAVESVRKANEEMNELGKSAKEINQVTDAISGISDQTKLLALNATIEAARAGEAGTRFAVVASEVKALAGQASKATKDIQDKVTNMQRATDIAIQEIQNINKVILEVNEIVMTIATSVEEQSVTTREIASNMGNVADGINDMSYAVTEAAQAIQEVTSNLSHAAQLTNSVTLAINEVSNESEKMKNDSVVLYASAMEVSSRSSDVRRMTGMFKLPADIRTDRKEKKLFVFSEPYSVKVKELDEQHKGIFDYINKIHEAIKDRRDAIKILPILHDLQRWTQNHFKREEDLMTSVKYEGLTIQKQAHKKLLEDLSSNISKIENKEEFDLIQLLVFLKDWLLNHIMGMDKKYSEPMNKNGIK